MNTVRVGDRALNLNYMHSRGDNRTVLDGTFVLDPANKVSANYALDSGNCKLKYSYVHKGLTTIEPTYDVAKNSWDFAVSRKVYGDDSLRATYQTSSKVLGVEWARNPKHNAGFKVRQSGNQYEYLDDSCGFVFLFFLWEFLYVWVLMFLIEFIDMWSGSHIWLGIY